MKRYLQLLGISTLSLCAQELDLKLTGPETQLSWKRIFPPSSGVPSQIRSRILSSTDLTNWVEDTTLTLDDSSGNGISSILLPRTDGARFYRLEQFLTYTHRTSPKDQPAVYNQQFLNTQADLRSLSLQAFSEAPEDPACLPAIEWDPTTAAYFEEYNTAPADHNANLASDDPERRLTDFRLNEAEMARFLQNGFVVSETIALKSPHPEFPSDLIESPTPVDFYYKIWTDDLPVFITSDSVLDAWHQSFQSMLEEVEELILYPALREMLIGNQTSVKSGETYIVQESTLPMLADLSVIDASWQDANTSGAEHVRQAIKDLELYLGTAGSLIQSFNPAEPTTDVNDPSHWFQSAIVHTDFEKTGLYGDQTRIEDMTLFQPRGHYANSQVLSAYFQTILWLSRAQFHIASTSSHADPADQLLRAQRDRELRAAILLALEVRDRGFLPKWKKIEGFMQSFVGQSNAMTVEELLSLLESLSLDNVLSIASDTHLSTIREALLSSTYGVQEIDGGRFEVVVDEECVPEDYELPRALSLFGQRWTPDAWTFNKVVFPQVVEEDEYIHRRVPSGLDVAYAVFGNDTARPILADRMTDTEGVPFRDGYPYQTTLESVRSVFDAQQEEFWTEQIYGYWLHSLRALSPALPSTAPDTFRTTSWKKRILNTQLMSWSQLRHDTLLYAEQSFTPPLLCEFPDGYVDPYPELWERLSGMALQFKSLLATLPISGEFGLEIKNPIFENYPPSMSIREWTLEEGYREEIDPDFIRIDRGTRYAAMSEHLENFSGRCLQLKEIAERQLAGLPHTSEMRDFLKATVEDRDLGPYGEARDYSGWFPRLYFPNAKSNENSAHPSVLWNPVIADVHTDSADVICTGDPGAILHEGTGRAQFMLTAVKHADGTACVYGGPVMSHYEILTSRDIRLNDDEWLKILDKGDEPQVESWKLDFLVPEQP